MNATLEGETTGFPISLFGTTCSTALYYLSPAPRPPAAAGTGCSSGSQRGSAPLQEHHPKFFPTSRTKKRHRREGAGRKGLRILGVPSEARSRSWENDLSGQGRAGPSLSQSHRRAPLPCPPKQQGPRRVGALGGGVKPRDGLGSPSLWDSKEGRGRRGGLPPKAQVNTAVPPSSGEGTSPSAPQAVVWELPKGPHPEPR